MSNEKNSSSISNCVMCGKIILSNQEEVVSEINGARYVFHNNDCQIFFQKFRSLYGDLFEP